MVQHLIYRNGGVLDHKAKETIHQPQDNDVQQKWNKSRLSGPRSEVRHQAITTRPYLFPQQQIALLWKLHRTVTILGHGFSWYHNQPYKRQADQIATKKAHIYAAIAVKNATIAKIVFYVLFSKIGYLLNQNSDVIIPKANRFLNLKSGNPNVSYIDPEKSSDFSPKRVLKGHREHGMSRSTKFDFTKQSKHNPGVG